MFLWSKGMSHKTEGTGEASPHLKVRSSDPSESGTSTANVAGVNTSRVFTDWLRQKSCDSMHSAQTMQCHTLLAGDSLRFPLS